MRDLFSPHDSSSIQDENQMMPAVEVMMDVRLAQAGMAPTNKFPV